MQNKIFSPLRKINFSRQNFKTSSLAKTKKSSFHIKPRKMSCFSKTLKWGFLPKPKIKFSCKTENVFFRQNFKNQVSAKTNNRVFLPKPQNQIFLPKLQNQIFPPKT